MSAQGAGLGPGPGEGLPELGQWAAPVSRHVLLRCLNKPPVRGLTIPVYVSQSLVPPWAALHRDDSTCDLRGHRVAMEGNERAE